MKRKQILRSQSGFTLIEIISVLVLLGILAAVAVPRFINLQADARNQAANSAVAEGVAQVNMLVGRFILLNSATPANMASLTGMPAPNNLVTPYNPAGSDFTITFTNPGGAKNILVTAAGNAGTTVAGAAASKTVTMP